MSHKKEKDPAGANVVKIWMGQCRSRQCEYPDLVLMTFSAPSSAAILASSCSMFSKWRMKLYGRKQTEQNSEYGRQCPSYLGIYFLGGQIRLDFMSFFSRYFLSNEPKVFDV